MQTPGTSAHGGVSISCVAGEEGLDDFRQHYRAHLEQLASIHPGARVVMLSPIAIEGAEAARQAEVEFIFIDTRQGQLDIGGSLFDFTSLGGGPVGVRVLAEDLPDDLILGAGSAGAAGIYTESGKPLHIIRRVIIRMQSWLYYF